MKPCVNTICQLVVWSQDFGISELWILLLLIRMTIWCCLWFWCAQGCEEVVGCSTTFQSMFPPGVVGASVIQSRFWLRSPTFLCGSLPDRWLWGVAAFGIPCNEKRLDFARLDGSFNGYVLLTALPVLPWERIFESFDKLYFISGSCGTFKRKNVSDSKLLQL